MDDLAYRIRQLMFWQDWELDRVCAEFKLTKEEVRELLKT